ncbi:hypothetical protein JYK14_19740 [Siccirubricoccus sp. KC 17139]|uniref:Uncharacterized protein n=1 Tax=Siccirubricoccus soli TaxID=2899147 RepID=A0ABT1DBN6_9PROT|nr:hypothetical protein [Siccirubricoccus soli]MCO6418380.1 hypothetical protein [Siccirubricoccus soli]MCP2684515.1 hypothetical protein [Siccirubricoccus soli]
MLYDPHLRAVVSRYGELEAETVALEGRFPPKPLSGMRPGNAIYQPATSRG